MDLPGIDYPALAAAVGCKSSRVERAPDIPHALARALDEAWPVRVEIPADPKSDSDY